MPTFPDGLASLSLRTVGVISHYPAAPVNYAGAITLFTEPAKVVLISYGEFSRNIMADAPASVSVAAYGSLLGGFGSFGGLARCGLGVLGDGALGFRTQSKRSNLVKWSNIGSADFTIWKDNIAGERYLDWPGYVYAIKKLGNKAIVYGENGVSMLIPIGNTYGLQTIHRIGVKGRDAVAGDESTHFFIDTSGALFTLGENRMKSSLFESSLAPTKLGYEEYLSTLNNPVMSLDSQEGLIYVCDSSTGFVYSITDNSLGSGPKAITGIGRQGGYLYAVASKPISIDPLEICTDVYDFGTAHFKTIHRVDVGINVSASVAIDYRRKRTDQFSTTWWKQIPVNGKTLITAKGREFRIRIKTNEYVSTQLNYIRIQGIIHES